MLMKRYLPFALPAVLLVSPLTFAQDASDTGAAASSVESQAPADDTSMEEMATPGAPGAMDMGETGMMMEGPDTTTAGPDTTAVGPGMPPGPGPGMMMGAGPMMGKMGCKGMMGKGMGQGMMGGMGGGPGMMGMMQGGKGGMMGGRGGMQKRHRELANRLDLLDARMAKIETMLERLLQR